MIYLKQITDVQKVLVPKGRDVDAHEVFFEVSNDFYHETLRAVLNKKNELYYEVLMVEILNQKNFQLLNKRIHISMMIRIFHFFV